MFSLLGATNIWDKEFLSVIISFFRSDVINIFCWNGVNVLHFEFCLHVARPTDMAKTKLYKDIFCLKSRDFSVFNFP